jgi:hypothetical protein
MSVRQKKWFKSVRNPVSFNSFGNPELESSFVNVTQPLVPSVDQFPDGIIIHDAIRGDRRRELQEDWSTEQVSRGITHSDIGRSPVGKVRTREKSTSNLGSCTSVERPEIGGVSMLPVIPDLVDHLGENASEYQTGGNRLSYSVMQLEQGIYDGVRNV